MKHQTFALPLLMIGAFSVAATAVDVDLGGIVTDQASGTPLKDAVVRLQSQGLSDTTDGTGKFQIRSPTTGVGATGPSRNGLALRDGSLLLQVDRDARVAIQTYSTEGRTLFSRQESMPTGVHQIALPALGQGTYFHKVQVGDRTYTIKQSRYDRVPRLEWIPSATDRIVASRTEATIQDTLVATLSGYTTARLAVGSSTATNLQIQLSKINTTPGAVVKARVINTTDLQADVDDEESLVHMFVTSNEVDIEGLIVVTSCFHPGQSGTTYIDKWTNAYEQVYPNLKMHASDYPTPAYIKSIVRLGQKGYSMGDVGVGKDSPGSDLIIAAVDKDDPRPVWVNSWGGSNTIAQALTKVKATRTQAQLDQFLSKLRVYDVLGQDEAGAWIAKNFPNLLYIRATGVYGWQYSKDWVAANVQNKGELGKVYPSPVWAIEGDSPAFMHQLAIGLNDPDKIDQGGWGGRFDLAKKTNIASMSAVKNEGSYQPYLMYGNTSEGAKAISRWSDGYTNDFAARMIWSTTSSYSAANHHPIAVVNGDRTRNVLYVTAKAGTDVVLDGNGSSDPDKNNLSWSWSQYAEPSTGGTASISGGNTSKATVKAPAAGKTLHVILTLKDNGTPALTAYRRVVVTGN